MTEAKPDTQGTEDRLALATLIDRIGTEVRRCHRDLECLQKALSDILAEHSLSQDDVRRLQELDATTQHLDELALLMARLEALMPQSLHVDANHIAAPVRLEALERRLRGQSDASKADTGGINWF